MKSMKTLENLAVVIAPAKLVNSKAFKSTCSQKVACLILFASAVLNFRAQIFSPGICKQQTINFSICKSKLKQFRATWPEDVGKLPALDISWEFVSLQFSAGFVSHVRFRARFSGGTVLDCWRFQKKNTAGWKLRRFFIFLHTHFGYTRRPAWTFVMNALFPFIYLCQGPVAAVALVLPWFRQQFSAGRDAPKNTPASLVFFDQSCRPS